MSSLPNLSALELRILELSRAQNFCSYDSMPESVCVAAEDSSSSDIPESPPSSPGSDRAGNAGWCSCGKCKPMDTADECLCCREVENVCKKQTVNCITDNEYFEILCLDTEVLRVSFTYIRDTEEYGNIRDIAVNNADLDKTFLLRTSQTVSVDVENVLAASVVSSDTVTSLHKFMKSLQST
ncbi:uncharacterized protein LOC135384314 [Ornithodoros turicata]|uniref:uncharacterized protein LOC135384314 n=1 Tax=Ornithodoros turicata TaxID=34597 RepID=UPI00313A11DB